MYMAVYYLYILCYLYVDILPKVYACIIMYIYEYLESFFHSSDRRRLRLCIALEEEEDDGAGGLMI